MHTCLIHQQMYWDFCPQCGPPLTITTAGTACAHRFTTDQTVNICVKCGMTEWPATEPNSEA